ncbi:MAG: TrkA family potassium uptake protein [Armatimonadetes bacterium]|nr:TrkA family potassium uptake protein [Armatimonadota bacterium]
MRIPRQFAVIGLGRFGAHVATGLYRQGHEVLAVDEDAVRVDMVKANVTTAVVADATSREALEALAVSEMDGVIVGIGRQIEASVLVTALLRELGCQAIVARAATHLHADILARVGATRVVYPEDDEAERVVRALVSPQLLDLVELEGDIDLAVLAAPEPFIGHTPAELQLRTRFGVTLVAIRREEQPGGPPTVMVPGPHDEMLRGDRLYLVGDEEAITRIGELDPAGG